MRERERDTKTGGTEKRKKRGEIMFYFAWKTQLIINEIHATEDKNQVKKEIFHNNTQAVMSSISPTF